jgi:myosin heavy subunit
MSTKKKKLAKDLLDLKANESSEAPSFNEDLDLDDIDLELTKKNFQNEDEAKTAVDPKAKDKTIRLVHTNTGQLPPTPEGEEEQHQEDVKVSYGLPAKQQVPRTLDTTSYTGDDQLKNSEHLRMAQRKINELEEELIKLRRENEDLASAGETFKKLNDDYYNEIESLKAKLQDNKQTSKQEIKLLKGISQNKEKQINDLKRQVDDYKSRIDNNFQRVRKREKDLEHRLEIAKIEEAAVVKSKDQLILDLKRRIDEITHESDNFRKKSQENYKELERKQQVVRGAVRALRMALTKLEGDDDSDLTVDITRSGVDQDD